MLHIPTPEEPRRRVFERDTDALFDRALRTGPGFGRRFLALLGREASGPVTAVELQTRHRGPGHRGTIDLELRLADSSLLLIENKIDAGYSVTRCGEAQPDRYRASTAALRARGTPALAVLLAPRAYLAGSRHAAAFDACIAYEDLRPALAGSDLALLEAAIAQAEAPYEPDPNAATAAFFEAFYDHAARTAPELALKLNPNGGGVRPTASRTIYIDVPRTLRGWAGVPRPRMSIQCRDAGAPTASAKIMLGGLGLHAERLAVPAGLARAGGYLRPAGRSLGCVVDTPRLDTQTTFAVQRDAVDRSLAAAVRLVRWWNASEGEVRALVRGASA